MPSLLEVAELELGEHFDGSITQSGQNSAWFESIPFNTPLKNEMYFMDSFRISCLESFLSGVGRQELPQLAKRHVDVMLSPTLATVRKIPSVLEWSFETKPHWSSSYCGTKISNGNWWITVIVRWDYWLASSRAIRTCSVSPRHHLFICVIRI